MSSGRLGSSRSELEALASTLARAGFPDARREARELIEAAHGDADVLRGWAERRQDGEPLEWLIGFATFMGNRVVVDRGVYVPRRQTEPLVQRAIQRLPENGLAVDLGTGSGAIAVALGRARPKARVVATDVDSVAVRCAAKNGVEVYQGHLAEPLPADVMGQFHVVVAVVPYVPSDKMIYLPRDVQRYEPAQALDGGPAGTELLMQVVSSSDHLLRTGGWLFLELGGNQDRRVLPALREAGFDPVTPLFDDDGDLRGVEAQLRGRSVPAVRAVG